MKQAIEGRRVNAFGVAPEDLAIIGRAVSAKDGRNDTRHADRASHALWDPRALISETDPAIQRLARNMKARGFRSTINVIKDGDLTLVVDGRRRVIAARLCNRWLVAEGLEPIEVICRVERVADEAELLALSRTLNAHRLNDDPMQIARDMQVLVNFGKSHEYIGDVYGETPAAVKRYLGLLDAAAPVQHAVTAGKVSVEAAITLTKLPRDEQKTQLAELTAGAPKGGRITVKAARDAVAVKQGREVGPTPRKPAELRAAQAAVKDADGSSIEDATARHWFGLGLRWALGDETPAIDELLARCRAAVTAESEAA